MKAATIHEIKQELTALKSGELVELCLRLGKFKKENKELLTYLLFEAKDEEEFVQSIKADIDKEFCSINFAHLYFAKKSLRKVGRLINKFCRYSGLKETEIRLRIYFCQSIKGSGIPIPRNPVIHNLYLGQLKKIKSVLSTLHEDLQYDYVREINALGI